jgi:hypothetical protein
MEFVAFEIAKKLKEKKFPQHWSDYHYVLENEDDDFFEVGEKYPKDIIYEHIATIAAPTISQVLKWLREEKKIHVNIDIIKAYPAAKLIYWGYNIVLIDKYEVYHFEWNSNSYEEAAFAGIEYVLDNLI